MGLKLENNARGNLASPLSANDTMVRLQTGQGALFPELVNAGDWFPLTLTDDTGAIEHTRAVTRIGDTVIVERAQESTTARDYEAGDPVYLPLTKGALTELLGAAGPLAISIDDTEVVG